LKACDWAPIWALAIDPMPAEPVPVLVRLEAVADAAGAGAGVSAGGARVAATLLAPVEPGVAFCTFCAVVAEAPPRERAPEPAQRARRWRCFRALGSRCDLGPRRGRDHQAACNDEE